MITAEEIAVVAHNMLQESNVAEMISGQIDYERNDYAKEDVIIVPHRITGEGSVRFGQVNVNIHVPDLVKKTGNQAIITSLSNIKGILENSNITTINK